MTGAAVVQKRWNPTEADRVRAERAGESVPDKWVRWPRGQSKGGLLYADGDPDLTRPIVVCEGATAADAVRALGLQAAGLADEGAGEGANAAVVGWFAGAAVTLWPDADRPGRDCMTAFAHRLLKAMGGMVGEVRMVDPARLPGVPDPLPKGWDAADWTVPADLDPAAAVAGAAVPCTAEAQAVAGSVSPPDSGAPHDDAWARLGLDALPAPDGVKAALATLQTAALGTAPVLLRGLRDATAAAALPADATAAVRAAAVELLKVAGVTGGARLVDASLGSAADGDDGKQGRAITWDEPDPWPDPVDPAALLDRLADLVTRFVALPDGAADAIATWALWTWAADRTDTLPLLALTSPTKRCGKTTLLLLLERMVRRPQSAASVSGPALYRLIERDRPTLLLDECDQWLRADQTGERIGILNAGHRPGGAVTRCVGEDFEPRTFAVDCAKGLASIGDFPDTLADRSVAVTLERAAPGADLERLRLSRHPDPDVGRLCSRWAADFGDRLADADPDMGGLSDRPADNWRPLYAIADLAGGSWPARVRAAAVALADRAAARTTSERYPEMLLVDCREAFAAAGDPDTMASSDLDAALHAMTERPWASYGRTGRPLTAQARGRMLTRFGVHTSKLWPANVNGYRLASFGDAWAQYSPDGGGANRKPGWSPGNIDDSGRTNRMVPAAQHPVQDSEKPPDSLVPSGTSGSDTPRPGVRARYARLAPYLPAAGPIVVDVERLGRMTRADLREAAPAAYHEAHGDGPRDPDRQTVEDVGRAMEADRAALAAESRNGRKTNGATKHPDLFDL